MSNRSMTKAQIVEAMLTVSDRLAAGGLSKEHEAQLLAFMAHLNNSWAWAD